MVAERISTLLNINGIKIYVMSYDSALLIVEKNSNEESQDDIQLNQSVGNYTIDTLTDR